MRISQVSLCLYSFAVASAWSITPRILQREQTFEQIEENDIDNGDNAWIIPADLDVEGLENAQPGAEWIPLNTFLKTQGIVALSSDNDTLSMEEDTTNFPTTLPPAAIFARQNVDTRVNIGKALVDYGCAASIQKPISEAIQALCNTGACDEGRAYTRQVDWLPEGRGTFGAGISRRQLRVAVKGEYRGATTKGNIIEAAKRSINPDTVAHGDRMQKIDTTTCQNWGICQTVECRMSKFSNFMSIAKVLGGANSYHDIDINISLHTSNNRCLAANILAAVGGAISGIAGGFFGVARAFNSGGGC